MKNSFPFLLLLLCAINLCFLACEKETLTTDQASLTENTISQSSHLPDGVVGAYYTPNLEDFATNRSSAFVEIPGGSVDALADAIDGADLGAVIYLKVGTHTLNERLTITKPVKIIGEDGAALLVTSNSEGNVVDPGIHVLDAPGTLVQNVSISAIETGGWTAILFENSSDAGLLNCSIDGFNRGVIVEHSHRMAIMGNTFTNQAGTGLLVNNGKSAYVANNTFKNAVFQGVWACDEWGTLENNTFEANNEVGVLLCNWPAVFGITKPDGSPLDALLTATGWKIKNNVFKENEVTGLVITDGAHWSLVETNNTYLNNGEYDIGITADTDFGFIFLPAAYDNTIYAEPDVLIKDCGDNTTIYGGDKVDPNVDPC